MSGPSRSCCMCLDQTILFVVGVLSTSFARALFGLIHFRARAALCNFKCFQNQVECFLKQWICMQLWILIPICGQFPFQNNFKQTMICPVTRANINEPCTKRINLRYHFSMTFVTQQRTSSNKNFSIILT